MGSHTIYSCVCLTTSSERAVLQCASPPPPVRAGQCCTVRRPQGAHCPLPTDTRVAPRSRERCCHAHGCPGICSCPCSQLLRMHSSERNGWIPQGVSVPWGSGGEAGLLPYQMNPAIFHWNSFILSPCEKRGRCGIILKVTRPFQQGSQSGQGDTASPAGEHRRSCS